MEMTVERNEVVKVCRTVGQKKESYKEYTWDIARVFSPHIHLSGVGFFYPRLEKNH
jgi:hypothetical protein